MDLSHLIWPTTGWGYSKEPPESFYYVRDIIDPKHILEIGFRYGHSSTYLLNLIEDCSVTSFDPGAVNNQQVREQSEKMKSIFKDRFNFYDVGGEYASQYLERDSIDFAFIDGNHTYTDVKNDIKSCLELNVTYMLFDNYETAQVKKAVDECSYIIPLKIFEYSSTFKGKTSKLQQLLCQKVDF